MASKGVKKRPFRGWSRIGIFPGQYYDEETGLHYNWNRYYDPSTGRYLRTDPAYDGLNLYTYVQNNPLIGFDPWGLTTLQNQSLYWSDEYRAQQQSVQGSGSTGYGSQIGSGLLLNSGVNAYHEGVNRAFYSATNNTYQSIASRNAQTGVRSYEAAAHWFSENRNQLLRETRRNSFPVGKSAAEWMKPSSNLPTVESELARGKTYQEIIERGVTRPSVNRTARILRAAGPVATVGAVGLSIYDIATAPEGQRGRTTASHVGGWTGALSFGAAGAKGGAVIGALIGGPPGAAVGATVGFIGGSISGSYAGSKAGENVYDFVAE